MRASYPQTLVRHRYNRLLLQSRTSAESVDGAPKLGPGVSSWPDNPPPTENTKEKKSFWDVMAVDGPAPEIINGRLAMLGVVCGLAQEVSWKDTIADQVLQTENTGLFWALLAALLLSWASIVPLVKGRELDSRSGGFFSARAELLNGRLAMVGFLGILIVENIFQSPLLPF